MPIPISQIPGVASAPSPNAMVSPEAAAAPYKGLAAVGQAIEQVGGMAERYRLASKAIKDNADVVHAKLTMQKSIDDFETWTQNNSDPSQWGPEWQKRQAELRKDIDSRQLSRAARQAVSLEWDKFSQDTSTRVTQSAQKRANDDNRDIMLTGANTVYQQGDRVQADGMIDHMERLGLLSKGEGEVLKARGKHTAIVSEVSADMANDPIMAELNLKLKNDNGDFLVYKDLDPNTRVSLTREAEGRAKALRTETGQAFQTRIENGEQVDPDEIKQAVETKHLTAAQEKQLRKFQSMNFKDASTQAKKVSDAIAAWDPATDPHGEYDILGMQVGLPEPMRRALEAEIKAKKGTGPVSGQEMTAYSRFIDEALKSGAFSPPPDMQVDDPTEYENDRWMEVKTDFFHWMKGEGAKKSPEERRAYLHQLMKPHVDQAGAALSELPILNASTGFPALQDVNDDTGA